MHIFNFQHWFGKVCTVSKMHCSKAYVCGCLCSRRSNRVVVIDVWVVSSVCLFIALMVWGSPVPPQSPGPIDLWVGLSLEALKWFGKVRGGLWVMYMI